jgi:hypothetical protein
MLYNKTLQKSASYNNKHFVFFLMSLWISWLDYAQGADWPGLAAALN